MQRLNLGVIVAIFAGGVFGLVTAIEGNIGRAIGAINASLLEHAFAGLIAIPAITYLFMRGTLTLGNTREILPYSALVGVLVLISVAGVAYAMSRTGVAAGNMALLFGQLAIAVLIDTVGFIGYEKVPLTWPRIAGLALMVVGVYLVLPRQG